MTTLSAEAALEHISRQLTRRGIPIPSTDPDPGPNNHAGQPGEPGDPEWHRAQRVELAMARWQSMTPPVYQEAHIDHPDVIAWSDAVSQAWPKDGEQRLQGPSLLLWGGTGVGKTHAAFGGIRRIAAAGVPRFSVVFTSQPEMYASMRPKPGREDQQERLERQLMRTPLLLLDDIGTAKESAWTAEILYRVVNHRYNQRRPTIFTSNYSPKQLREVVGDRIHSRLAEMTTAVRMDGPDRRLPRRP